MPDRKAIALQQLDSLIGEWEKMKERWTHGPSGSRPSGEEVRAFIARERSAIRRIGGADSVYEEEVKRIDKTKDVGEEWIQQELIGVIYGLRSDVQADFVVSLEQLIHGELFADYLEMSDHLLDEGYKDPAAVLGGGTLEAHLRQLCAKNSIPTTRTTAKGPEPKKAESMNQDLGSGSVYAMLDQKNVTAWLDLRNKAAHGKYTEYTKEQVGNMLSGIRDFLTRNPA